MTDETTIDYNQETRDLIASPAYQEVKAKVGDLAGRAGFDFPLFPHIYGIRTLMGNLESQTPQAAPPVIDLSTPPAEEDNHSAS